MPIKVTGSDKNAEQERDESLSRIRKKHTLHDIDRFIYDADSIDAFRMDEAIQDHPLIHRPTTLGLSLLMQTY